MPLASATAAMETSGRNVCSTISRLYALEKRRRVMPFGGAAITDCSCVVKPLLARSETHEHGGFNNHVKDALAGRLREDLGSLRRNLGDLLETLMPTKA